MLNAKGKERWLALLSFLLALVVMAVLVFLNPMQPVQKKTDGPASSWRNVSQSVKTAAFEQTVSLTVCAGVRETETPCLPSVSTTFQATPGTYNIYGEITRGPADQTEESFSLTLNGSKIGDYYDNGVDGTTKVLLAANVSISSSNTLVMDHLVPNEDPDSFPNSVTVEKIYLDNSSCFVKITDSGGAEKDTFNVGDSGKLSWDVSNAFPDANKVYFSCGDPDVTEPTGQELTQLSGTADLSFSKAGGYWCVINVMSNTGVVLNKSYGDFTCGDQVSVVNQENPTCWMKADGKTTQENPSVTVPATGSVNSLITWGTDNATSTTTAEAACTGPIPIERGGWWPNMAESDFPSGYSATFPAGTAAGTEKCSIYLNGSQTESCSISIAVNAGSTGTCGDGEINGEEECDYRSTFGGACDRGYYCATDCTCQLSSTTPTPTPTPTYSCTGTTPANATLCSGDDSGLTANVAKTLVSACTTSTKCEYTCNSGYSFSNGVCVALVNGSCGSASKTYSYSSTSFGSDTFCSSGSVNPSNPSFPAVGSYTSWTCEGSGGGVNSSCRAYRSSEVINGECGDLDGDTLSSKPSSDDDDLCSSGNRSSISGDGPWYWTCEGVNGGSSENCSANETSVSYSPTVTVIPITEYTYSYTAKAAPATGTATNVALLLSISAVVSLGVWMVLKKIKG